MASKRVKDLYRNRCQAGICWDNSGHLQAKRCVLYLEYMNRSAVHLIERCGVRLRRLPVVASSCGLAM